MWNHNSSTYLYASMGFVNSTGGIESNDVTSDYGVRPVINLKSDVTFSSGNGLKDTPYIVS